MVRSWLSVNEWRSESTDWKRGSGGRSSGSLRQRDGDDVVAGAGDVRVRRAEAEPPDRPDEGRLGHHVVAERPVGVERPVQVGDAELLDDLVDLGVGDLRRAGRHLVEAVVRVVLVRDGLADVIDDVQAHLGAVAAVGIGGHREAAHRVQRPRGAVAGHPRQGADVARRPARGAAAAALVDRQRHRLDAHVDGIAVGIEPAGGGAPRPDEDRATLAAKST
jgi:hypothetical protein